VVGDTQVAGPRQQSEEFSNLGEPDIARIARGGDSQAVEALKQLAIRQDVSAQFDLALLYRDGLGVTKDATAYVDWLRRAGDLGHVGAQVRLIGIYEKGKIVPQNYVEAAGWARRAANQGDAAAIGSLVLDYYYGRGVSQSFTEAVKWHEIAVALGTTSSEGDFPSQLLAKAGPVAVAEGKALAAEWLTAYRRSP